MWSPEDFPGANNVPWQLLIRARYAHELDAFIASAAVQAIAHVAPQATLKEAAAAAFGAVERSSREPVKVTDKQKLRVLSLVADWEDGDICPKWWPWPPRPHSIDEIGDPAVFLVVREVLDFVGKAGSEQLGAALTSAVGGFA